MNSTHTETPLTHTMNTQGNLNHFNCFYIDDFEQTMERCVF